MNRVGKVYNKGVFCGLIKETEEGYSFVYDDDYLNNNQAKAISITTPLTTKEYKSKVLFAFF